MIADPFPVDQYYVTHPAELFESSLDDLVINVDNDVVLEGMRDECILISSANLCG
jgi:DEAD/DEAH box helicase domain-containing protein